MRRVFNPESSTYRDPATGRLVRQITTANAIHHHPFFLVPAYDRSGKWLFFISHRTGAPQIFAEERSTRRLIQLTDVPRLNEWSIHPAIDGAHVYFTTQQAGYRLEVSTQEVQQLIEFKGFRSREAGMVAGGMGTTALSSCGTHWAIKLSREEGVRLVVVNTKTLEVRTVTEHDAIAHMQFCPEDPNLLFFAGNFKERLWTVRLDGSEKKLHYRRQAGQWITHESWIPSSRDLAFVDWPHAVRAVNTQDSTVRDIAWFNAWHAVADGDGTWMVADTKNPDRGIYAFPVDASNSPELICLSESSNAGDHWDGPFPYEDGPIEVNAPQHTHPHPRFAPGNSHIVFTSDRTGTAQLYEVQLGDGKAS